MGRSRFFMLIFMIINQCFFLLPAAAAANQIKRQHRQGVQQRTREGVVRAAFDDIVKRSRERAQACVWQQDQRLLNHVPHLGKIHQTQRR